MLELVGWVVDGVIVGMGLMSDVICLSLEVIECGVCVSGWTLVDLDVWWFVKINVADTRCEVIASIMMALVASVNYVFRFMFEGKGVFFDLHECVRCLQCEYDVYYYEIVGAGNAGFIDCWGFIEFFVDCFVIVGTLDDCVVQIRCVMGAGVW